MAIKKLPKKKSPGPDKFTAELTSYELKMQETLPNSFCEASIIVIPKTCEGQNSKRDLQANLFNKLRCKNPQ
jgi:hypothetical protein